MRFYTLFAIAFFAAILTGTNAGLGRIFNYRNSGSRAIGRSRYNRGGHGGSTGGYGRPSGGYGGYGRPSGGYGGYTGYERPTGGYVRTNGRYGRPKGTYTGYGSYRRPSSSWDRTYGNQFGSRRYGNTNW